MPVIASPDGDSSAEIFPDGQELKRFEVRKKLKIDGTKAFFEKLLKFILNPEKCHVFFVQVTNNSMFSMKDRQKTTCINGFLKKNKQNSSDFLFLLKKKLADKSFDTNNSIQNLVHHSDKQII